jgi:hypothetical protein
MNLILGGEKILLASIQYCLMQSSMPILRRPNIMATRLVHVSSVLKRIRTVSYLPSCTSSDNEIEIIARQGQGIALLYLVPSIIVVEFLDILHDLAQNIQRRKASDPTTIYFHLLDIPLSILV